MDVLDIKREITGLGPGEFRASQSRLNKDCDFTLSI